MDIINMMEPPLIIDYRIPRKPPIIVNKTTQAFEKEFVFEFRLKFTSNFKKLASGSRNPACWTITLFADSDKLRAEWVKHLKKVYQTTLLAMLEEGDADSSQSAGKIKSKPKLRKEKSKNKVGVLVSEE